MNVLFKGRPWAIAIMAVALAAFATSQPAFAQSTTGSITGTVTDSTGKPMADVKVDAASGAQTAQTTTNASGFYSLINLTPDTYSVSFQRSGYNPIALNGVSVFQNQNIVLNETMSTALKVIANVTATGSSNLVKPNQGSDVYNVGGAELSAATNPLDLHETVYQYFAVTPGITSNGFPGQPRVRGGQVTDLGYEFEGIPIQDRMTGYFSSNLSNIGIQNVEVYTGGLDAANSGNGTGFFNTVLKNGTYPGFTVLALQATSPEANQYAHFESGWATADHRFSAYVGFNGVNSQNQYDYGENAFPNVLFWGYDGPGPVNTRDWVSNFHFRPSHNDDFQFVYTNSLGNFNFNYLLGKSPGEPPALGFLPCPGAVAGGDSQTGATGGTAPNGQTCTDTGLYWTALTNPNIWYHYGALGKLQWNHTLNAHSAFNLNLWTNYNQYIFNQPLGDPNIPNWENPAGVGGSNGMWEWFGPPACPNYPYAPGSPLISTHDGYDVCSFYDGIQSFYGDRRSNMFGANFDYQNALSDKVILKAGLRDELDNNIFKYYDTNGFTVLPDSTLIYPAIFSDASFPTNRQELYAEAELHFGHLMIDPGLAYIQEHYAFPIDMGYATGNGLCPTGLTCTPTTGGQTEHVINPTFNGTWTFDPNDVVRFSYGNTASLIGSEFIYNNSISQYTVNGVISSNRNPWLPGSTFQPQINHAADIMWEHNFADGTSLRFGPYYNKTSNYYASYRPFLGNFQAGCDVTNISSCTPCSPSTAGCLPFQARFSVLTNNNIHKTFGFELGLNHVNNRPHGMSYWLSATYDNFWTSAFDISGAFINSTLPSGLLNQGVLVRGASNPLFAATLTADYHSDRFHLDPQVYYQGDTFFNTGDIVQCIPATTSNGRCAANGGTVVPPYFASYEQIAHGWWRASIDTYEELGPKRNFVVGMKVDNLFDNVTDTTPCPSDGTGCFPFDGPYSGIVDTPSSMYHPSSGAYGNNNWIYENYSQGPRLFYFYLGVKM